MKRRGFLGALGALLAAWRFPTTKQAEPDGLTWPDAFELPPPDPKMMDALRSGKRYIAGEDLRSGFVYIGQDGKAYNARSGA